MNGPDHYREAERYLGHAREARSDRDYESAAHFRGMAHIHATLALAAASVNTLGPAGDGGQWLDAFGSEAPN